MNEEIGLKSQSDDELEQVSGGAESDGNGIAICRFCGKRIRKDKILIHMKICSSNPNRETLQEIIEEEANGQ